jgi:phosphate/sulfate permease
MIRDVRDVSVGAAFMNFDPGAVNYRTVLWIFSGWVLTLPVEGLIADLIMLMALKTPHI